MPISAKNIRLISAVALIFSTIILLEIYLLDIGIAKISKELFYTKSLLIFSYYEITLFITTLFVASIFFIKSKKAFIPIFSFIIVTYAINKAYLLINGNGFGFKELQIFLHEASHFAGDAFLSYSGQIYHSIAITGAIIGASYLMRRYIVTHHLYISPWFITAVFILAMATSYSVWHKTAGDLDNFPTPFKFVNTIIYHMENSIYFGDRQELQTTPDKEPLYNNIVWIIDESIGGAYLSINGNDRPTTPYLESVSDRYINLGLASSAANCSADSHLILMSGIQLNQLPDEQNLSLKTSSIFQYAKKAGYRTHYISGQSEDKVLQNYLTQFDLEDIDNFYQPPKGFDHTPAPETPPEEDVIKQIELALSQSDKNFLFVVKRGTHFHWETNYPESEKKFRPSLGPKDPLIKANKIKAINSYQNSIRWTVDKFFESLLPTLEPHKRDDMIIFYTADHGQSIIEGKRFSTHCDSTDPHLSQGVVPLLIFPKSVEKIFQHEITRNSYTHYQLFPATVWLMGYDSYRNGISIFEDPAKEQIFFSGDPFGRANSQRNDIKDYVFKQNF